MSSQQPAWFKLKSPPFMHFVRLLSINNKEFLIVPQKGITRNGDGIYKYNAENNEWIKIIDYEKHFISTGHIATYDKKHELIYVCNQESQLIEMDLNTKKFKILSTNARFGSFPGILYVDGNIHIVGGLDTNKHFIYDKNRKEFMEIYDFNTTAVDHAALYIKSRKSILKSSIKQIGDDNKIISSSFAFSVINQKWSDWNIPTPEHIFASSIVATKNEEYLIFIGGMNAELREWTDCISIYNVKNNEFKQSNICCPVKAGFAATITRNDDRDQLLTFGFINNLYESSAFSNIQSLPYYLLKLIGNWVCYETVHIIAIAGFDSDKNHWMMTVDNIIQSIQ